mmetsp:Transcript_166946/g.535954  ORF Transcript_166946/g.535954 Transcript_166946/m.535954 type:complete len:227 (+) Transcript_166946:236-916(+)
MSGSIAHVRHPHRDGLARKAAVAEGHDCHSSGLHHSMHLLEDLAGPAQVVHAHDIRHEVELVVAVGHYGVEVEVLGDVLRGLGVAGQLGVVHACDRNPLCFQVFGVVRYPRAADVQGAILALRSLGKLHGIEISDRSDGAIVDVCHDARGVVEVGIIGLVLSFEIAVSVGPCRGPLRRREHLADPTVSDALRHLHELAAPADNLDSHLGKLLEADQLDVKDECLAC